MAAGSVRAYGIDNATRFDSLVALVKRRILGPLHGIALHQRPGFPRGREGAALFAVKAQFHRTFAAAATRLCLVDGGAARSLFPGYAELVAAGTVDDRAPGLEVIH